MQMQTANKGCDNMKYTGIDYLSNEDIMEGQQKDVIDYDLSSEYTFIYECNFYKLFLIFIVGSIFGCYMEQIQYYFLRGIWESRAGVIWGPFSEIYGLGAVLIFLLSRRLKDASPLTIFLTTTICGSAFEYSARLFQEIFLGSITWDYSKQPFNIGGRTSLKYGIYWGLLGLLFIKWIFPQLNHMFHNIKGRLAFSFTWIMIVFMTCNLLCSALAVNRWNERIQGTPSNSYIDSLMDDYYGNDKMEYIFPHLKFIESST
jgi:uncharacterized membrane protein